MKDIDILLGRYLNKEALTTDQEIELLEWISQNREEYEQLIALMKEENTDDELTFDASKAWRKVEPVLTRKINFNTRKIKLSFAYAASLLLLLGITILWNLRPRTESLSCENIGVSNENIMLPDSSSIVLYPGSKVQYKGYKNKGIRKLILTGKAFFKVKKNKDRPFVIDAYNVKVEVLGTSFLVDAIANDSASVSVKTGIVKVGANDQKVILRANEQAKIREKKILKAKITDPAAVFGEKPLELIFDNAPIEDVVRQLEVIFNVKIELDKKVKQNKVTSKLKMDNLSNILLELNYICDCKCDTISNNHYKFYHP